MNTSELRDKSVAELTELLIESELNGFNLTMAKSTGQLGNTHEIKQNRRSVARIKTLINEKKQQGN